MNLLTTIITKLYEILVVGFLDLNNLIIKFIIIFFIKYQIILFFSFMYAVY